MSANSLGQSLIIDPAVPFTALERELRNLGWTRSEEERSTKSLIRGEPEFATWTWHGRKPFVIYTFNPVARLRVLDVATLPPFMRGAIAAKVAMIDERRVEQLFESEDIREQLLALWAAQETQRLDLIKHAERLIHDPEAVLAEQARIVSEQLRRVNEARCEILVNLRILTEAAPPLIQNLTNRNFVQGLKPAEEELSDIFDAGLKPFLMSAVEAIYGKDLRVSPLEPEAGIEVFAAPAGLLRWSNMLSEKFPLGYRDIAGWMNPKRIWMGWTVTTPRGGTVRYDGLVWLDGRWVWLPKVFRYIQPFLLEDPAVASHRH